MADDGGGVVMQHSLLPDIVKSQVDGGGGRRARGHVVVEVEGRERSDSGLASHKLRVRDCLPGWP